MDRADMTAPMPETMSPREKVARAIKDTIRDDASIGLQMTMTPRFVNAATDRILAALASSGDHAELLRVALQDSHELARRGLNPDVRLNEAERYAIAALIAEVAALREREKAALRECSKWARQAGEATGRLEVSEAAGIVEGWRDRATEAERKLAEAVGVLRDLSSWFDGAAHNGAWIIRAGDLGADDAGHLRAARTFLSKEAERG